MKSSVTEYNLIEGTRVYLSGPMDFLPSRSNERKYGWRRRVSQFLHSFGATVFDPWYKPLVKGLGVYGEEGEEAQRLRDAWTFDPGPKGAKARSKCSRTFWKTLHIDLRMVDLSDFVIACCPTNLYSVGTPHEIALARQQRKPVLFVSPPVPHPTLVRLRESARTDSKIVNLLDRLETEVPIKPNPKGIPSLWYMALLGSENFFDGFGFSKYRNRFDWKGSVIDEREDREPPKRPLLPFVEGLANGKYPKGWDYREHKYKKDDDWLLLDIRKGH